MTIDSQSIPAKILVTVKRVPDPDTRIRVEGGELDLGGAKFAINPFDAIALEEAVRLKERTPSIEVLAVSVGAEACAEQLQSALAMGADRALLLLTGERLDALAIAKLLAKVWMREKPGLVLMGKQAIDDDANQVGQMLAGLLGLPQATFVSKLECSAGRVRCHRETDNGIEVVEAALPAVVTADLRLNEPRYISLPSILRAKKKPMERLAASDFGPGISSRTSVVRYLASPKRASGVRVKSVDELIDGLRARTGLV